MKKLPQSFLLVLFGVDSIQKYSELIEKIRSKPIRFRGNLIKIRNNKGLKQKELCSHLGISESLISIWETGQGVPSAKNLLKLSEKLEVSPELLIWGEI